MLKCNTDNNLFKELNFDSIVLSGKSNGYSFLLSFNGNFNNTSFVDYGTSFDISTYLIHSNGSSNMFICNTTNSIKNILDTTSSTSESTIILNNKQYIYTSSDTSIYLLFNNDSSCIYSIDSSGYAYYRNDASIIKDNQLTDKKYVDYLSGTFNTISNISSDSKLLEIPHKSIIESIVIYETTGNNTGNISIGSTPLGADIINALTINANELKSGDISANLFSLTLDQSIYISSSG
jgi:hypothetical protein